MNDQVKKFRTRLRCLLNTFQVGADPSVVDGIIYVLSQEKDRLELLQSAASRSPLPADGTETPDEVGNEETTDEEVDSISETADQDLATHPNDDADQPELPAQNEIADEDLREVAERLVRAERVIVLVGAGISTNCGIPDFRSVKGIHRTYRGMFDVAVLNNVETRKQLFECLTGIRETSRSTALVQTDTHRFLRTLKQSSKLQRCYTQNFDGLETRAGLNTDLDCDDCEAVQLHGNLNSLRCTFCAYRKDWDSVDQTDLLSGEAIPCIECRSRQEERRLRGARANTHVGFMRPDIVLFDDAIDPSGERKAELIDQDCTLDIDMLLVIGTSLAIDGIKKILRSNFIPAVRRWGGKTVYVNKVPPPKAFDQRKMDFIFEMDCDLWVQKLAQYEPSLASDVVQPGRLPSPGLDISPKARSVAEAIQAAESTLVSIGDYSDMQYRLRDQDEVREELGCFHIGGWLSTSPLMGVLSLFEWGDTTKVLRSSLMDFGASDAHARAQLLRGAVWPIGRKQTRVVIPHNPGDHWILMVVDIPNRVVYYYNSLSGYDINVAIEFLQAQMRRVGEEIDRDYSTWNGPIDGGSLQQTNSADCGIYLLENARRISQGASVNGRPIIADDLRIIFVELLIERSSFEASERSLLKSVSSYAPPDLCRVESEPRPRTFRTMPKRRRLRLEDIEAQREGGDEVEASSSDEETSRFHIEIKAAELFTAWPSSPWLKYLESFASFRIQRSGLVMGYAKAFRLLQIIASFGCPEHFVALKSAIIKYRMLRPYEVVDTSMDVSKHLYEVALWTERMGLINALLQRIARAHLVSLIDEGKDLYVDRSRHIETQQRSAVVKAVKAMVINLHPHMKGWDTSDSPSQVAAFTGVQKNLQRWRREGWIWSLIQRRFGSLALLVLAPHHTRVMGGFRSISSCSFQTEIPSECRCLFVEALNELRPSLRSYVPKLAHVFDMFANSEKFRASRYNIELLSDDDILESIPDSSLLINAFQYSTSA